MCSMTQSQVLIQVLIQGAQDPHHPLSLYVIFCKSDVYLVTYTLLWNALLWHVMCNSRHPVSLCHPVRQFTTVLWLISTCVVTYSHMWHDSFIGATWLFRMCDMTHSQMWHDSSTRLPWHIDMCKMTHCHVLQQGCLLSHMCYNPHMSYNPLTHVLQASHVLPQGCLLSLITHAHLMQKHAHVRLDSCTCATCEGVLRLCPHMWGLTCEAWLLHLCDITHSHLWHVDETCHTHTHKHMWRSPVDESHIPHVWPWLIHMCGHDSFIWVAMTHTHMWHDSFTYVTWLIHMCDMTHSHMWHDSFTYVTWLVDRSFPHVRHDSFTCVWMSHVTCMNESWSHMWRSDHETCHTCGKLLSMSHVTFVNESWLTYWWVMSQTSVTCVSCICPFLYNMCKMNHSHVLPQVRLLTHHTHTCVLWLIYMCNMTHSYP